MEDSKLGGHELKQSTSAICKGAHLMGAVGALAPTVFLPCSEIIHISVPLFLPRPEVVLILSPTLFSPVQKMRKKIMQMK